MRAAAGETSDDAIFPMITRKSQGVMRWIVVAIEERTVETYRQERPGRPTDHTWYVKEVSTRCFPGDRVRLLEQTTKSLGTEPDALTRPILGIGQCH